MSALQVGALVLVAIAGTGVVLRLDARPVTFPVRTQGSAALPEPWKTLDQPPLGISIAVQNRAGRSAANHVHLGHDKERRRRNVRGEQASAAGDHPAHRSPELREVPALLRGRAQEEPCA